MRSRTNARAEASHAHRAVLEALRAGPATCYELTVEIGLTMLRTSRALHELQRAGLVGVRRERLRGRLERAVWFAEEE